ncbi:lactoylglutathione lyase [Yangia mangrovi]|uniref:Lactoylglutathione lyase n=1 Tax=Alloyangia mangrovi TaxID=1779329 RepID=A0ABT2KLN0_9RHOB|nr:VOC family protein [Alloyangia mangrovi]MCA0942172.1 lactoylglutathione lyase [Alloyangia pacifica]MCA0947201.1 lactoylglutathione lyase [Alloyangia pacifica]MCT4371027.1 lactoylglutathione lyase [Alloyangia mangrovi]
MSQMIFINLPVADLDRSVAFYEAIGFTRDAKFSNELAASMVLSEEIRVMLLTHGFWSNFTDRRRVDPATEAQVLLCISRKDRAAVDAITEAAVAAGGTADPCPAQDHGFMYGRSFADPDGHIWEPMWMSAEAVEAGPAAMSEAG